MKIRNIVVSALVMCALYAMPAFAQSRHTENELQHWINHDPRLQADPGLMDNPTYLRNHPNFATWLREHPGAHRQVNEMGAYDRSHQWRDTNWWRRNDPDWVYQNHRDWVDAHPEWREDGDWDDEHHWHDRDWYEHNNAEWAHAHHPNWKEMRDEEHAERHEEREERREQKWQEHHEGDHGHGHGHGHDRD